MADKPLIYGKMADIMADVDAISKDRQAGSGNFGYNFRGVDDIYNALHPIFAKHRVFIVSNIINAHREQIPTKSGGMNMYSILDIEFRYTAEDGSFIPSVTRGEAMDSGDKSSNKSMSIALKYSLLQTLLIPTVDEKDPDATIHEVASRMDTPKSAPSAKVEKPATKLSEWNDAMEIAISSADSRKAIVKIWNDNKHLHTNTEFTAAVKKASDKYPPEEKKAA